MISSINDIKQGVMLQSVHDPHVHAFILKVNKKNRYYVEARALFVGFGRVGHAKAHRLWNRDWELL